MSDAPAHTGTTTDMVEVLIGLGEGPIGGLSDGLKSFYFGETPVQQPDGTMSFDNVTITIEQGSATPAPIHLALGGSASSQSVGVQLLQNSPVTRTTSTGNLNFLDVRMLAVQVGKTDGGAWGAGFNILYKKSSSSTWLAFAGSETAVLGHHDVNGRFTNQIFEYRQAVEPDLTDTYDIQVVKTTPESDTKYLRDMQWESFQEIISGDKSYPNVAMAHVQAQSSNQFTSVPQFWGIYDGFLCRVPTNFDPDTRTFSGVWDGTFKVAVTDDPAWILYEVVMNSKWGFNAYYPCTIDKYDVYAASQWTSEPVPDGQGGFQPRYTYNRWIKDPMAAMDLLNTIAGSFGGRCFDDQNGTILLRLDIDSSAVVLFTPENVENGLFNYSYSDLDQRSNELTLTFPNPELLYQLDRRYISNQDSIDAIGRIHLDYQLDDCTNVHEAIRRGYLRMITTITEKEQVSFNTNRLGCTLSPFEIFLVADPDMGYGLSGRVKTVSVDQKTITLRDPLPLEAGITYTFQFQTPVGILEYEYFSANTGSVSSITFDTALNDDVINQTTFNLGSSDSLYGLPKPYRCLKVGTVDGNAEKINIVGLEVNRNKWAAADNATFANSIDYSNRKAGTDVKPPIGPLTFNYSTRTLNGKTVTTLNVGWNKSADMFLSRYRIEYDYQGTGAQLLTETVNTSVNFDDPKPGAYVFYVYALNSTSNPSAALTGATTVGLDTAALPVSPITGLEIAGQGNNTIFVTKDVKLDWRLSSAGQTLDFDDEDALNGAESGAQDSTFQNFIVQFYDTVTGELFFQDTTKNPFYNLPYDTNYRSKNGPHRNITVKVSYRDIYGSISNPAVLKISNPVPIQITGLTLAPGQGMGTIIWPKHFEPDVLGYRLYATTTFDGTKLAYDGPNNSYVYADAPAGETVSVQVGAYDGFDSTIILSDPFVFTVPPVSLTSLDDDIKAALKLGEDARNNINGKNLTQTFDDLAAIVIQNITLGQKLTAMVRESGIEYDPVTGTATIYSVKNLTGQVNVNASALFQLTTAVSGNARIFTSDTAPAGAVEGDLWVDTADNGNVYRWNGVSWVYFGPIAATVYSTAQSVIALNAQINDPTTGITALANAVQTITVTVTNQGTTISANSSAITALQSTVNNPTTGVVATSTALNSLTTTVTTQGGTITSQGVSIVALQSTVNDPTTGVVATSGALTTLTTTVTSQGGTITSQGSAITALQSTVNNPSTGVVATSNALSTLTNTVTVTQAGQISANSSAITALQSTVNNPTTGVVATASAVSSLTTVVTNKNTTFVSNSTPTANAVGDLWCYPAGGNTMFTWSGSAWVQRSDLNKVTTFAQSGTPTGQAVGDVWINTGSGNTMSRWNGSSWVAVDNATIASTASAVTAVNATVGNFSASGLFRVNVASTPSGADARIAIQAAASGGGGAYSASIYIDALTGGTSRVTIVASQFYLTDGSNNSNPFFYSGGVLYMNSAVIQTLSASVISGGTLNVSVINAGSITTSHLAGASVSNTVVSNNGGTQTIATSPTWTTLRSVSFTATGGQIICQWTDWWDWTGAAPSVYYRVMRSGTQIGYVQSGGGSAVPQYVSVGGTSYDAPSAGTYTYTLEATHINGTPSSRNSSLIVTELKR